MKKYFGVATGLLAITLLLRASQQDKPGGKAPNERTLVVQLNYTGSGTVDEKHKIFVVIFDSPNFQKGGAMPIEVKESATKNGTVSFTDLTVSPVYAAASYDPSGNYDGQSGPPPSGSSLGMYSKTPGTPAPIALEADKTVRIQLPFDDTAKMP